MGQFLVLQLDTTSIMRDEKNWREIDRTEAKDAGCAFRDVVLPNDPKYRKHAVGGEYLVVPLEGSARLAVELNLRDLNAQS